MNLKAILAATVAAGIVANIIDFFVHGSWLNNAYYSKLPQLFKVDANPAGYIIGDFVTVAVFAWFYQTVGAAFRGSAGGMKFGVYTGIVVAFPSLIMLHMMLVGFPYALSWIWIVYTVLWYMIVGTLTGWVFDKVK
jgi:hypothetical protein